MGNVSELSKSERDEHWTVTNFVFFFFERLRSWTLILRELTEMQDYDGCFDQMNEFNIEVLFPRIVK